MAPQAPPAPDETALAVRGNRAVGTTVGATSRGQAAGTSAGTDADSRSARQYALADRAAALGWPAAAVEVIDEDQGHSGSSAEGRSGFQRLLAEVSSDRVGLILGLEMSRLARSCKDWHALLELCAIYRALLGDADGLYDPSQYNDRLLLALKGTMPGASPGQLLVKSGA